MVPIYGPRRNYMKENMLIFALKHNLKGSYYLLIEDGLPADKVCVVSPEGDQIFMEESVFASDPIEFTPEKFSALPLTQQQKYLQIMQEKEQREKLEFADRQKRQEVINRTKQNISTFEEEYHTSATAPKRSRVSPQKSRKKAEKHLGARRIEWQGEYLTFYKHKIDPLPPSGIMVITVGDDKFRMTKSEFEKTFNDVVMSPQYRQLGHLQFKELPLRIQVFKI